MTKSDFVDKVADSSGLSKKDAGTAVDAVLKSIEDALSSGDEVGLLLSADFDVLLHFLPCDLMDERSDVGTVFPSIAQSQPVGGLG